MKRELSMAGFLALGVCLMGSEVHAGSQQPLPTPFPEKRYKQMSAKSPFAVATAQANAVAAATPGFAAQLYVDGVAHIGKTDFVAIKSRDPAVQTAMFLEVGEITQDGMKVERVRWSDEMGKSTVDVSKGGENATLIFDEQQMAKVAGTGQAPMQFGHRRGFISDEVERNRPLPGQPGMSAAGPQPVD